MQGIRFNYDCFFGSVFGFLRCPRESVFFASSRSFGFAAVFEAASCSFFLGCQPFVIVVLLERGAGIILRAGKGGQRLPAVRVVWLNKTRGSVGNPLKQRERRTTAAPATPAKGHRRTTHGRRSHTGSAVQALLRQCLSLSAPFGGICEKQRLDARASFKLSWQLMAAGSRFRGV